MNRPWIVAVAFILCLVVGLGAMGWISLTLLKLEKAEMTARAQAAIEENVRLALWRLDSAIAPLLARETGRPYFVYNPFYSPQRAYNRMYAPLDRNDLLVPSPLLTETPHGVVIHFQIGPDGNLASPQAPTGNMRDVAEGQYVPSSRVIDATARLRELGRSIKPDVLRAALPPPAETRPGAAPQHAQTFFDWGAAEQDWQRELDPKRQQSMRSSREYALRRSLNYQTGAALDNNDAAFMAQLPQQQQQVQKQEVSREALAGELKVKELDGVKAREDQQVAVAQPNGKLVNEKAQTFGDVAGKPNKADDAPTPSASSAVKAPAPPMSQPQSGGAVAATRPTPPAPAGRGRAAGRGEASVAQRAEPSSQPKDAADVEKNLMAEQPPPPPVDHLAMLGMQPSPTRPVEPPTVVEGMFKPVWCETALVLARRVNIQGDEYVQGFQLDWPALVDRLLGQVKDLLPNATLQAVVSGGDEATPRLLASLPVRLLPGATTMSTSLPPSALRWSLALVWCAALVAVLAVGLLLRGAVALGERRGAFVSAVTHELRTPLTTFRLYTEMLADNMVPDERARRKYLETLRAEADRLGHLVENVLAFARLERGRRSGPPVMVGVKEVIDRMCGRLTQRAEQAGMVLRCTVDDSAANVQVLVDPLAVEQVLFNLVDNACKYAAEAEEKLIDLRAERNGRSVTVRVRDRGPGFSITAARRRFRLFRKSAQDAADSAPGIGLGLALSRRLAFQMGGCLRVVKLAADAGAGACLELRLPAVRA